MSTTDRLKIAIQKSGRLNPPSLALLASLGLEFLPSGNALLQPCRNADLDLLFLRDDDIPEYVSRGVADFAIVGENVLLEKQATVEVVRRLDFGRCRLVIAVPEASEIRDPRDLEGERIATTYPHLLARYLKREHIDAAIIPISGSVEITPELNLADAVCDIVQTGNTLTAHRLRPLVTILESRAVLIGSPLRKKSKEPFLSLLPPVRV